jgi:hypothetical protein
MLATAFSRYINNYRGFTRNLDSYVDYFYQPCRYDGFAISIQIFKEDLNLSYAEVGWIMVAFGMGSMLGSWLGGKLSDKIGFTKSWFSVCSPAEYYFFSYNTSILLGIVRRNVYHNDRGGYVSSRHVCLAGHLFKTRESPGH